MEKQLKTPKEFEIGDVINTCLGYTVTLLELVEIHEHKWSNVKWHDYKVINNFSDNVYIHGYNSHNPQIIIDNIGQEEVDKILRTKPFRDYERKLPF